MAKLLLNHENIEHEINNQLRELKMLPFSENGKATACEIAKCVSRIHSHDLSRSKMPAYDVQWVRGLVRQNMPCDYRDDILSALESMGKFERYNYNGPIEIKKDKFMAWDISDSNWQSEYKSGHAGSYAWDIAAIINHANDPSFSDAFLDGYIRCGGQKPTLAALYSNLYYVQVAEAAMGNDFEKILRTTKEITEQDMFKTELIPYETIVRLKLVGY
jgi:hypothetical protein